MLSVYLAGPIAGRTHSEAWAWRNAVSEELKDRDVIALSPLRGIQPVSEDLSAEVAARYEPSPLTTPQAITARDRNDIARCDVVLVNLVGARKVSIGTMVELGWADAFGKPIVLCMEPGNPHEHEIVRQLCPWIVPNLRTGVDVVLSVLGVRSDK